MHFAIVCERKALHGSVKELTEEFESILSLSDDTKADDRIYADILINGKCVKFLLDGGSTANAIPRSIYENLSLKSELRPVESTVCLFNNFQLPVEGTIEATLTNPKTLKQISAEFYVTRYEMSILSLTACTGLNLIQINYENICDDSDDSCVENTCIEAIDSCQLDKALLEAENSDFYDAFIGNWRIFDDEMESDKATTNINDIDEIDDDFSY